MSVSDRIHADCRSIYHNFYAKKNAVFNYPIRSEYHIPFVHTTIVRAYYQTGAPFFSFWNLLKPSSETIFSETIF